MIKILMVCMGNICRSPLAEGIMKRKLNAYGIDGYVDSAGTIAGHTGEAPDERSCRVALENGLDISMQKARQIRAADLDEFDYIFAMDSANYANILKLAKTEDQKKKVELIMNRVSPGLNLEVPDPYYGNMEEFVEVFDMLNRCCEQIAKSLKH